MDIERVLGVFQELLEEEDEYKIQNLLNDLASQVNNNNSAEVDKLIEKIESYAKESVVNEYSFSKIKVLEKVDAIDLFGKNLKIFLEELFKKEIYKLKENLAELIKKRNTLLSSLKTNVQNLEKLDFESYYDSLDTFELGLIIPKDKSELKIVHHYLKEWHFVLRHIGELCDKEHREPKIYSVSDSSLGIFFLCSLPVTKCVLSLTKDVLDIYKKVLEIKELKERMNKYDFKQGIKEANKKEKQIVNEEKERIVQRVLKEYEKQIPKERKSELETGIKRSIEIIIRLQDDGVLIETTPPKIEEPEESDSESQDQETEGTENRKSKLKDIKDVTEIFADSSRILNELSSTGNEILQIGQYLNEQNNKNNEQEKS